MDVQLIDYTGAGRDPLYAARLLIYSKETRLDQSSNERTAIWTADAGAVNEQLAYIANTIRSSWEFVDFTFAVAGMTVACARQVMRARVGVSFAQQSMRVVDMRKFTAEMPMSIRADAIANNQWELVMEDTRATYEIFLKQGIPPEDARGVIPLNAHTSFLMKVNLRALADMIPKRDNPRAQGEHQAFVRLLEREANAVMPWTRPFLRPERTRTPALDELLADIKAEGGSDKTIAACQKELDSLKATWG